MRHALLLSLFLPLLSLAQQNKITIDPPEQISVKRGGTVTETLKLTVAPGVHVNSDRPKDEFIIPLKLTWTDGPLVAKSVAYPKAEEIKVGSQMLTVFTGNFAIQTSFQAAAGASAGPATVNGKLRYQACNNEMCFRPATAEVRLPVIIQ